MSDREPPHWLLERFRPLPETRRPGPRAERRRALRAVLPGRGAVPAAASGAVPRAVLGGAPAAPLNSPVRRRVRRVALPGRPRLRERMGGDRRRSFASGVIPGTIPPESTPPGRRRGAPPHQGRSTRDRSRSHDDAV